MATGRKWRELNMKQEILDYLILGGYSFKETATEFDVPLSYVREVYEDWTD